MLKTKNSLFKFLYALLLLLCVFVMITLATSNYQEKIMASVVNSAKEMLTKEDVLIIDPGHGGMDGGAESAGGICEKDINLAIAAKIKELALGDGWKVKMTRDDDRSVKGKDLEFLWEKPKKSIRMTKTEDLLARKALIDKEKPLLAVSIHLNSFKEDPRVRGAQVFYTSSGDEGDKESARILDSSKLLGETVQKSIVDGLKDGTDRKAMGKKDVRLLKDPKAPTIIVECGFLSNTEEAKLLNDYEYQEKLATLIYEGIMKYSNKRPKISIPIIEGRA